MKIETQLLILNMKYIIAIYKKLRQLWFDLKKIISIEKA